MNYLFTLIILVASTQSFSNTASDFIGEYQLILGDDNCIETIKVIQRWENSLTVLDKNAPQNRFKQYHFNNINEGTQSYSPGEFSDKICMKTTLDDNNLIFESSDQVGIFRPCRFARLYERYSLRLEKDELIFKSRNLNCIYKRP